jgi:hypothetical protein
VTLAWPYRESSQVTVNTLTFTHSGNTSSGNERHGFITTGSVNSDQTLAASDLPYILQSASGFVVLAGKTLTINPGAVLKFDTGANLTSI